MNIKGHYVDKLIKNKYVAKECFRDHAIQYLCYTIFKIIKTLQSSFFFFSISSDRSQEADASLNTWRS